MAVERSPAFETPPRCTAAAATTHTDQVYHMHCANFPRHLGRLITRCLIAHPDGADTIELALWAYGEVLRYAPGASRSIGGSPGLFPEHRRASVARHAMRGIVKMPGRSGR